MPRMEWPHVSDRPVVKVEFQSAATGDRVERTLLADSGAGERGDNFDLILTTVDCIEFGGILMELTALGGAYSGEFPVYFLPAWIPGIGFSDFVRVVGAPITLGSMDGFACFPFLNQFTYGNFGSPDSFGLEFDPTAA